MLSRNLLIITLLSSLLSSTFIYAKTVTVTVMNINNNPVSDLVVFLEPLENQKLDSLSVDPLIINQEDKKFAPYISVIQKGLPLTFLNKDSITHHIYSASSKNRFSFRLKSKDEKLVEDIMVAGKVVMGCNIHDWMSGYLLVVDTPIYSKTNSQGKVSFEVPEAGRYQLKVWHPQLMEKNQEISRELNTSEINTVELRLTKKMAKIQIQENPDNFDFLEDY